MYESAILTKKITHTSKIHGAHRSDEVFSFGSWFHESRRVRIYVQRDEFNMLLLLLDDIANFFRQSCLPVQPRNFMSKSLLSTVSERET